ncbi:hypothetical protein [Endozoicomonas sp. 4G]|uniref:hypothetical protein n=1 Tax=Endozoicomonas sp. 4G TaxID=2872754 RepID=UPI002078585F|nr:hypothetical protein [Endozoicomonas sp. 4G]
MKMMHSGIFTAKKPTTLENRYRPLYRKDCRYLVSSDTPGLGLKGIWLSFPVANTIGAVFVILLFRYILAGLKKKHRALEQEEQVA